MSKSCLSLGMEVVQRVFERIIDNDAEIMCKIKFCDGWRIPHPAGCDRLFGENDVRNCWTSARSCYCRLMACCLFPKDKLSLMNTCLRHVLRT